MTLDWFCGPGLHCFFLIILYIICEIIKKFNLCYSLKIRTLLVFSGLNEINSVVCVYKRQGTCVGCGGLFDYFDVVSLIDYC